MDVKVKRLSPTATLPTYGSEKAAGMDLYADCPNGIYEFQTMDVSSVKFFPAVAKGIYIAPHTTAKIGTGLAIQPPNGYFGAIFARSGLATKQGLRPANCVGVCDEDYTGEYIVALHNDTDKPKIVHHGDRIAQLVFLPYVQANLVEVDELDETDRSSGGFGSTGV